jgi:hypothetical protein
MHLQHWDVVWMGAEVVTCLGHLSGALQPTPSGRSGSPNVAQRTTVLRRGLPMRPYGVDCHSPGSCSPEGAAPCCCNDYTKITTLVLFALFNGTCLGQSSPRHQGVVAVPNVAQWVTVLHGHYQCALMVWAVAPQAPVVAALTTPRQTR